MIKIEEGTMSSGLPVYRRIQEDLLRDLRQKSSARLPSERELCRRYGVCRPTVHKALSYFLEKDMIVRRPGKGTFFRESVIRGREEPTAVKLIIRHDWQSWEGDSYFGQAVQGVFSVLNDRAFSIGIEKFCPELKSDLLVGDKIASIWLSPEQEEFAAMAELADADRMVVALNREVEHAGIKWVSSDHHMEGEIAGRHLRNCGHERVIYFSSEAESNIARLRDAGMRQVLGNGYRFVPFSAHDWHKTFLAALESELTGSGGHCAVVINNGVLLTKLRDFLAGRGWSVPGDLSVIMFGDGTEAERHGITVIRQQVEQLGRLAGEIATAKKHIDSGNLLPCELIKRNSIKNSK